MQLIINNLNQLEMLVKSPERSRLSYKLTQRMENVNRVFLLRISLRQSDILSGKSLER